jgi:hypothetical protein
VTDDEILKQFEDELPELRRSASLHDVSEWVLDHAEALIIRNSRPNVTRHYPAQFYDLQFKSPKYERNIYDRRADEYRSGLICHCEMKLIDFNNGFRILDGTGIVIQNGRTSNDGLVLHCEAHFYEDHWPTLFVMSKMNNSEGKVSFFATA